MELATFNPGGAFLDAISIAFSAQNPGFAGLLAPLVVNFSDALGTWKPIGEDSNQFAAMFKRFLFARADTPTAAQLTNLQGAVVLEASGTFSATRIQIQPLAAP